jgi:DNA-binding transcriptional regulator YhcF (GntR family)
MPSKPQVIPGRVAVPGGKSGWSLLADADDCLIVSGSLAPGTKLPAEHDMAQDFGVTYDTVAGPPWTCAIALISTTVGRGTYVSERPATSG